METPDFSELVGIMDLEAPFSEISSSLFSSTFLLFRIIYSNYLSIYG